MSRRHRTPPRSSSWIRWMARATLDAILLLPRMILEAIRSRILYFGVTALMWICNGEEWVIESDQNILVSRRLARSWECFEIRQREKLKKGSVILYMGRK